MKYRKKPVAIEAEQWTGENFDELWDWMIGSLVKPQKPIYQHQPDRSIVISTLEGDVKANLGDYIVKGDHGEFYPCKPDIFEAIYEQV